MISSMLNFDGWRRIVSLPFQYYVWQGVVLLAGLLVLLGCSWLLSELNPKAAKSEDKWSRSMNAEILFLGNSQQRALDIKQFCRPALNISIGGSDYSTQFAILRNLRKRLPQLRVVVVGFDTLLLRTAAIKDRKSDYEELSAWGVPWWDIPEISQRERFFYFISHNTLLKPILCGPKLDQPELAQKITWQYIITSMFKSKSTDSKTETPVATPIPAKTDEAPPTRDIQKIIPPYTVAPAGGEQKMRSYVNKFKKSNHSEVNRGAFLDLVLYCRTNRLQMILLRTPTTKAFWGNRPPDWDTELESLHCEANAVYGEELPLWDEERSFEYDDCQFDDPNHLMLYYIQNILTPRINQRMSTLFEAIQREASL